MKEIDTLVEYLKEKLPDFQIEGQFPDPKLQLNLPALSIVEAGNPVFTNLMPILKGRIEGESVYMVGMYDSKLQLDIWTDYKEKRKELYERLHDVFLGQFIDSEQSAGLSLTLKDYYNAIARYDVVGYTIVDTEQTSQIEEWRVKVDVVVNYPKMIAKTESTITQASIKHEIGEEADLDNYDINETLVVF